MDAEKEEQSLRCRIGAAVRAHRIARGMTLKELAAAAGITPRWLSAVERGQAKRLTVEHLHRIAEAMGVPVSEWFDPTGADGTTSRRASWLEASLRTR